MSVMLTAAEARMAKTACNLSILKEIFFMEMRLKTIASRHLTPLSLRYGKYAPDPAPLPLNQHGGT